MLRLHYLLPVCLATALHAGELTLEAKPFFVSHKITATVLPTETHEIKIDAQAWTNFEIESIATHGSSLKKGDSLLKFKTEDIDKKIADTRQQIASETLTLAQAKLDLENLEKTIPESLARLERNAQKAAEELEYFTSTGRKIAEDTSELALKQRERQLASLNEELKQLLQMYEADDLTEDTEEIILQKQRDSIETAKFMLHRENLTHKRNMEINIPRQGTQLTESRDDTTLALVTGKSNLPRSLELKKIEVANLETSLERNKKSLADLEKDRELFEINASENGIFYLGTIKDSRWITGEPVKALAPQGIAPIRKAIATLIPSNNELVAHALLDQNTALAIQPEQEGSATLSGRSDLPIPVTLASLSTTPNPDNTYTAVFKATWPKGIKPVTGQNLDIQIVSYTAEKAITIPTAALEFGPTGWTAEVKLADGNTEKRPVTLGKSFGNNTEITAGLEAGQVVITP